MDRLKNKTILIGKEPNQGRLLLSININGQNKLTALGEPGSVPNCVSRCKPAEGVAHCKITIDGNGSLTLVNLKPQNTTYVNGSEILSKRISAGADVTLGKDRYPIDITRILDSAKKVVEISQPAQPAKPLSIKHLEKVWLNYERTTEEIAIQVQKKGKRRMLPMVIGSASGLVAPLLAAVLGTSTLYVTAPISIISFIIYFKVYNEKDTSIEERKAAQNKLIDNYVCPKCKHYLGQQPYKVLRQNSKCPYCGNPWGDK